MLATTDWRETMTGKTVATWLERFVETALARDLAGHMAMISPAVLVFGVPGFDTLDYDDWYRQCAHEFPQGLLTGLGYSAVTIRTASDERILFKALETSESADGAVSRQGVEMLLEHEDGTWRLKQLRLLPDDEARHDGLLSRS
jgi:hypothetical protein